MERIGGFANQAREGVAIGIEYVLEIELNADETALLTFGDKRPNQAGAGGVIAQQLMEILLVEPRIDDDGHHRYMVLAGTGHNLLIGRAGERAIGGRAIPRGNQNIDLGGMSEKRGTARGVVAEIKQGFRSGGKAESNDREEKHGAHRCKVTGRGASGTMAGREFCGPACYPVFRSLMSLTREKAQLMSASEIDRTLVRLAHEILEKTKDLDLLAFIGIRRRGVPLAQRLAQKISALEKLKIPVGILDINLYRDDLSTVDIKPVVSATDIQFDVAGKDIILMDDVLYTGRTIRAALDALFDHGRPARVQLLVLIDRGHRELPIEAKFIGRTVQTTDIEIIEVKFQEIDGMEKVLLVEKVESAQA